MYTHTGYRRETGHVHAGRLYGHTDYRGKVHALNGGANVYSGATYRSLCGKIVAADHDGAGFNVRPAGPPDGTGISCRRCRAVIRRTGRKIS